MNLKFSIYAPAQEILPLNLYLEGAQYVMAVDSHPISFNYIRKTISILNITDKMDAYKSDCVLFARIPQKI